VTHVEGGGRVWSTLLADGLMIWASKPSGGRVYRFGLQNPGRGSKEERTTRGGIEEFMSKRSYLMKGAVASDEDYLELDHNALGLSGLTQCIEGQN
jgi:hypothetical protein